MTGSAIIGKLGTAVVRVFGIVKISLMAAYTGIGCITETLAVTGLAVSRDSCMCSFQHVKLVVDVKPGRTPARIGGVTLYTIIG